MSNMKYGRRYYDKTCRICGKEKKTVLTLHGHCVPCLARTILRHPIVYTAILLAVAALVVILARIVTR